MTPEEFKGKLFNLMQEFYGVSIIYPLPVVDPSAIGTTAATAPAFVPTPTPELPLRITEALPGSVPAVPGHPLFPLGSCLCALCADAAETVNR